MIVIDPALKGKRWRLPDTLGAAEVTYVCDATYGAISVVADGGPQIDIHPNWLTPIGDEMAYTVSTAGAWSVHKGTRVTSDGVDQGTVISDGAVEMFTAEDPAPLVIALMHHLGIERIDPTE